MERHTKLIGSAILRLYILSILFCSSAVYLFSEGCTTAGTTVYVDDSNTVGPWNGTQDYPFRYIMDGIAAANPGDTVFVSSGTYTENVVITKNLTLTGADKESTFIDWGGNGRALYLDGSETNQIWVEVSGFTIQHAGGSGFACVVCSYIINGAITSTKILDSLEGDGIQLYHCQGMTLSNNLISGNKMAGISASLSGGNTITSSIILYNPLLSHRCRNDRAYGGYFLDVHPLDEEAIGTGTERKI